MDGKFKFALVCLYVLQLSSACEDTIYDYLASKTPYRHIANWNHSRVNYPGCTPQKIWMLIRHGTRNPSEDYIHEMKTRLVAIRDLVLKGDNDLINSEYTLFQKWKIKLEYDDEKLLSPEGANEMLELAERMQARFPTVMAEVYSNTSYQFKYTQTRRTKSSAVNFATGLFGKQTARHVWFPEPSNKDPILRFYKLCDKWLKEVKKNASSLIELSRFKAMPAAKNAVVKIESRLGLPKNTLKFDDLHYIYMTCAFETAWNRKKRSPWCTVFDLDTIKVLEYAEDLKYYWVDGYGHDINYRQACPAFDDMYAHLNSTETYPKAVLYFTHSGTLLKMLAHIGLYKDDEPLMHKPMMENRKWRVSTIDSFGTNLAFVLFKCGKQRKLLVMHQERVVRLPSCPDSDLCDLETVREYYSDSVDHCSFNIMCRL